MKIVEQKISHYNKKIASLGSHKYFLLYFLPLRKTHWEQESNTYDYEPKASKVCNT